MENLSPLAYQMSLHFRSYFTVALVLIEVALLVFKSSSLPFPAGSMGSETFLLLLFSCLEGVSIHTGFKGNLTRKQVFLVVAFLLHVPSLLSLLYLLLWQSYVLRVERILLLFALGFRAVELVLGLVVMFHVSQDT